MCSQSLFKIEIETLQEIGRLVYKCDSFLLDYGIGALSGAARRRASCALANGGHHISGMQEVLEKM